MTDKTVTIAGAIELHLHLGKNHSVIQFGDRMIIDPEPEMAPVALKLQEAGAMLYQAFIIMPQVTMSTAQRQAMAAYSEAEIEYTKFHDKLKVSLTDDN